MKNIVLCVDYAGDHAGQRDATNAEALLRLLDESDEQLTWYHPGTRALRPGGNMMAGCGGASPRLPPRGQRSPKLTSF